VVVHSEGSADQKVKQSFLQKIKSFFSRKTNEKTEEPKEAESHDKETESKKTK
jgi:hypothetical protein